MVEELKEKYLKCEYRDSLFDNEYVIRFRRVNNKEKKALVTSRKYVKPLSDGKGLVKLFGLEFKENPLVKIWDIEKHTLYDFEVYNEDIVTL
jgi:hypothetical protein